MKKNRVLSLILSAMMLFTMAFPTGAFAEEIETQLYEPEVEEMVVDLGEDTIQPDLEQDTVVEQTVEEQPVEELPVEELPVEEQPVEEQPVAEEVLPFAQGYVCVNSGTIVYAEESKQDVIGSFSGDAIVYAVVSSRDADEAYTWLKITFDTVDAKEANEALLSGYVQFMDVTVLSDEAVEQLIDALRYDSTTRSYGDNLLPAESFAANEVELSEEVIVASVPEEEEEVELETVETESVVSVVNAASSTAAVITGQPESVTARIGDSVSFTVEAENADAYVWQYSKNNGKSWTSWSSAAYKQATLTMNVTAGRLAMIYRCQVTGQDGENIYSDAVSITEPIILNGVTYGSLTSTTCAVVSYSGTDSSLTIPDTVEGMTVTEIGVEAFMDNKQLTSIDLPDTITVIRARAFKGCTSLSDMH